MNIIWRETMKNDGEEMSIILTLAQLEGSEPNFYKQAKKMMKENLK